MNPTTTPPQAPAGTVKAEFVELPSRGSARVCGMSRSWWYKAERRGLIRMARPRLPGNVRGRTLLPVDEAVALIRSLGGLPAASPAG